MPYILSQIDTSSLSNISCVTNRFLIVNSLIHLTNHRHIYSKPLSFVLPLIQRHHACSQECDSQTANRSFTTIATYQRLYKFTQTSHTVFLTHRWRLCQLRCQGIHGRYACLLWDVVATAWQATQVFLQDLWQVYWWIALGLIIHLTSPFPSNNLAGFTWWDSLIR